MDQICDLKRLEPCTLSTQKGVFSECAFVLKKKHGKYDQLKENAFPYLM